MTIDEKFMKIALKEASKAYDLGEVPIGCVIVINDKVIARAHNLRHTKKCSVYHAEMLAIEKACKKLNQWILDEATIYVTLEPCIMCSGAIIQARIKRLVYGAVQERYGCVESMMHLYRDFSFNHHVEVTGKVLQNECKKKINEFFKEIRTDVK